MRYIIKSMRSYPCDSRNVKKINALQQAVRELENAVIADDDALNTFFNALRELIGECNRIYGGVPVYISGNRSAGKIFFRSWSAGSETIILSISYAHVDTTLYSSHIRSIISNCKQNLQQEYQLQQLSKQ